MLTFDRTEKSNSTSKKILDTIVTIFAVVTASAAFGLIIVFLIQTSSPKPSTPTVHVCAEPPVRREWRSLKTYEREEYLSAVKCLYNTSSELVGKGSVIDDFTWVHVRAVKKCMTDSNFFFYVCYSKAILTKFYST